MTRLDFLRPPRRRRRKWRNPATVTMCTSQPTCRFIEDQPTCNSQSPDYLNTAYAPANSDSQQLSRKSTNNYNHHHATMPWMLLVTLVMVGATSYSSATTEPLLSLSRSSNKLANLSTVISSSSSSLSTRLTTDLLQPENRIPSIVIANNMQHSSSLAAAAPNSSSTTTATLHNSVQATATLLPNNNNNNNNNNIYKPIVASFTTPNQTINFTHITYDRDTGRLYLGASNTLYQLDSNLKLEYQVTTGPVWDGPMCSINDCKGYEESMRLTTNFNKVLVIDHTNQMLLACGSTSQGTCRRHHLHNITQKEDLIPMPVAATDDNASTVAFIGPARYSDNQQQQQIYATTSTNTNSNSSNSYFMQSSSQFMPLNQPPQQVLYVAVTNSRPPRNLPAIGTRSLESGPNMLKIYDNSFADARIDIDSPLRDYFLVNYIYGFATPNYVYFATVQKKAVAREFEGLGYHTRLARVCVSDLSYNSYTEVDLKCTTNSTLTGRPSIDYPLLQDAIVVDAGNQLLSSMIKDASFDSTNEKVLIGLFTTNRDHTTQAGDNSAICVYPLSAIEDKFTDNIHSCYTGKTPSRNMGYIAGNVADCPKSAGNVVNFCSETLKINGSVPIIQSPAIKYTNTTLTAITATTINQNQHTVAFVGTSNGHLKKVLLSTINKAVEFEDSLLEDKTPILGDIHLDRQAKHVYVATPYKIMKVQAQRCGQYLSCRECSQSQNPFCGWCSLERRCTTRDECSNATYGQHQSSSRLLNGNNAVIMMSQAASNSRWLSMETQKCFEFLSINPDKIYIQNSQISKIDLQINQLPRLPATHSYKCLFGGKIETQALQTSTGLSCAIPKISQRGEIRPGKDHIVVDLAIKSSETNTEFLHGRITFFDCRQHTTCKDCVNAQWNCNWCLNENVCMFNTSKCEKSGLARQEPLSITQLGPIGHQRQATSLMGTTMAPKQQQQQQQQSMTINTVNYCPTFVNQRNNEILIPDGVEREVMLDVRNVPTFKGTFQCNIEIENEKMQLKARIEEERIICDRAMYTYAEERDQIQAQLTVVWNENKFIDTTNITIYKCHLLASSQQPTADASKSDCSNCLALDSRYQCSWCSRSCQYHQHCPSAPERSCPPVEITEYTHPLNGIQMMLPHGTHRVVSDGSTNIVRDRGTEDFQNRVITNGGGGSRPCLSVADGDRFLCLPSPPFINGGTSNNLSPTDFSTSTTNPIHPDYIGPMDDGQQQQQTTTTAQSISWSILSILLFLLAITMLLFVLYTLLIVFHRYYQNNGTSVLSAFNVGGAIIGAHGISNGGAHGGAHQHLTKGDERQLKRIQLQMESLERSIKNECHLASVALQQDLTDIYKELEISGAPVLDYKSYIIKVFFPGLNNHPLLVTTTANNNDNNLSALRLVQQHQQQQNDPAMEYFERLILNKPFLVTFINTLEAQATFSIKDRVNVASLLMIILMDRMDYTTDILRTLLFQLVEKSSKKQQSNGGYHHLNSSSGGGDSQQVPPPPSSSLYHQQQQHLLLRRTESVVEKMLTNWLAINMYDSMRLESGNSLYMLFQALKLQIDKGPLDAITNEAYYSLSEEHLLREPRLDFETLTLYVLVDQNFYKHLQQTNNINSNAARTNGSQSPDNSGGAIYDLVGPPTPVPSQGGGGAPFSLQPTLLLDTHNNAIYEGNNTANQFDQFLQQQQHQQQQPHSYHQATLTIRVLDCDTVGQVKTKILDRLYKNSPKIGRLEAKDIELELHHHHHHQQQHQMTAGQTLTNNLRFGIANHQVTSLGQTSKTLHHLISQQQQQPMIQQQQQPPPQATILSDQDFSNVTTFNGWKRLNTMRHYGIKDQSILALNIVRQQQQQHQQQTNNNGFYSALLNNGVVDSNYQQQQNPYAEIQYGSCNGAGNTTAKPEELGLARLATSTGYRLWHLVRDDSSNLALSSAASTSSSTSASPSSLLFNSSSIPAVVIKQQQQQHPISNYYHSAASSNSASSSANHVLDTNSTSVNSSSFADRTGPLPTIAYQQQQQLAGLNAQQQIQNSNGSSYYYTVSRPLDRQQQRKGRPQIASSFASDQQLLLTRMLASKTTVHEYVNDFFSSIFNIFPTNSTTTTTLDDGSQMSMAANNCPPAIKWLFDLLDEAALSNGITDPQVVHSWKSNSFLLRFWANLIKNPDYILDVNKTPVVDSSLSVIAQTLIDSCSPTDTKLSPDTSCNKLLFTKDIVKYRQQVKKFYQQVASMRPVSDQEMSKYMNSSSLVYTNRFNTGLALKELCVYAAKYGVELFEALDNDYLSQRMGLAQQLEQCFRTLHGQKNQ